LSKHQLESNDNINEAHYSVFKTNLINLIIWRFLIILCWVFILVIFPLMLFAEVMGVRSLQVWMTNNSFIVTLGCLLITIYVNYFLLNYTFLVGKGRVIVCRRNFKGKKIIGEFLSSDYIFEFERIRGKIGGAIGFFFIKLKEKDGKRKRSNSFPTGLSRADANAMYYTVEKLETK